MEMKDLIGRKCNIFLKVKNKELYYTGTILSCEGLHFTFSDRDKDIYMFRKSDVIEINDRIKKNIK